MGFVMFCLNAFVLSLIGGWQAMLTAFAVGLLVIGMAASIMLVRAGVRGVQGNREEWYFVFEHHEEE
jgi:hypothetical protein